MHATKSSRAQVRADTGSWRERWKRTQTDSWERGPQLATPRPLGGTLLLLLRLGCCFLSPLPTTVTQPHAIAAVLMSLLQFVRAILLTSKNLPLPRTEDFSDVQDTNSPQCCNDSSATTVLQRLHTAAMRIQPTSPQREQQNARPITSQMCYFIFTGIRVAARLLSLIHI